MLHKRMILLVLFLWLLSGCGTQQTKCNFPTVPTQFLEEPATLSSQTLQHNMPQKQESVLASEA